jgi:hypothetical protein
MSQQFSTNPRTRPTPPFEATRTPPCHPRSIISCTAKRDTRETNLPGRCSASATRGLPARPRAFVRLCRYPPTARQNPMHLDGHPPRGPVRQAATQEFGTTDAHRFTPMGPSPAWPFTADIEQPILASRAGAVAPVPSAYISVHLWFQILASPRAALGCGGGWSSPQAKPHAPIHAALRLRSTPGRQPRRTALHLREATVSPEWRHETVVRQRRWACPSSGTSSPLQRNETTARQARPTHVRNATVLREPRNETVARQLRWARPTGATPSPLQRNETAARQARLTTPAQRWCLTSETRHQRDTSAGCVQPARHRLPRNGTRRP